MSKRKRRTGESLSDARESSRLVTVSRFGGFDLLDGYVLAVGSQWCLLLVIDRGCTDGWTCFRTDDVRKVKSVGRKRLSRQLLKLDLRWPPKAEVDLDLDGSTSDLLRSCAAALPDQLLGIAFEAELWSKSTYPLYIGLPVTWRKKSVLWHDVNPNGKWDREPYKARYIEITRVVFGGRYLAALQRVAGQRPERPLARDNRG